MTGNLHARQYESGFSFIIISSLSEHVEFGDVSTLRWKLATLPGLSFLAHPYKLPHVVAHVVSPVHDDHAVLVLTPLGGACLRLCGVAAVQLDSMQTAAEQFAHQQDIRAGKYRLLFVSPERLVLTDFYQLLRQINVRTFAIDDAHCISHWGHDFRPEYRQLNRLKEHFPQAAIHAYTATATERVRRDISEQLRLVGIIQKPSARALVRSSSNAPGSWLGVGDQVEGWHLQEITEISVIIEAQNRKVELFLFSEVK